MARIELDKLVDKLDGSSIFKKSNKEQYVVELTAARHTASALNKAAIEVFVTPDGGERERIAVVWNNGDLLVDKPVTTEPRRIALHSIVSAILDCVVPT